MKEIKGLRCPVGACGLSGTCFFVLPGNAIPNLGYGQDMLLARCDGHRGSLGSVGDDVYEVTRDEAAVFRVMRS
jgi:hypothetical protein